jgi:two-component system phosphate regulon sensor histidine kinase PhoR
MQKEFIANASHELKTPVSTILSYCETLLDDNKEKDNIKTKFLKTMFSESKRMSLLIQDLLSLSRIERTEYNPPTKKINITNIFNEIKDTFHSKKNQKIIIDFKSPKKEIFLAADPLELKQVFINLVQNSLSHSCSKKPILVTLNNKKDSIDFSVKDFGIGIAQEDIPLLTKRFYRVDSARSRESGNTGLGLSIVKHIINRHQGELIIESKLDLGSQFTASFKK